MNHTKAGAVLVAPLVVIPLLVVILFAGLGTKQPPAAAACGTAAASQTGGGVPQSVAGTRLDGEQVDNAEAIVAATMAYGPTAAKPQAAVVAIATAKVESDLRNIDRDSLGLFQQRPSQGWGTPEQIMDPTYATRAFLQRLVQLAGWETMRLTDAAAAVQRPAAEYRERYQQWEELAAGVVDRLWDAPTTAGASGAGAAATMAAGCPPPTQCPPTSSTAETGLTPDALRVLRCVQAMFGDHTYGGVGSRPGQSDHPSGRAVDVMIDNWDTSTGNAHGWEIANWVRANAGWLGVTYVIFDRQIWSVDRDSEDWRPYTHPSGQSTPTLAHLDHVHVSVSGHAGTDPSAASVSQTGWTSPITPGLFELTSPYGPRPSLGDFHTGMDFGAPTGTAIMAATGGVVTFSGENGNYGNLVIISSAGGVETYYAHQVDGGIRVRDGQQVTAGEVIGAVGGTGRVTGPHLHFEVRVNGDALNPLSWLQAHGVDPTKPTTRT